MSAEPGQIHVSASGCLDLISRSDKLRTNGTSAKGASHEPIENQSLGFCTAVSFPWPLAPADDDIHTPLTVRRRSRRQVTSQGACSRVSRTTREPFPWGYFTPKTTRAVPGDSVPSRRGYSRYRVSASLQFGGRVARLSVSDDSVVRGRSDGDGLVSEPVEEQASCF